MEKRVLLTLFCFLIGQWSWAQTYEIRSHAGVQLVEPTQLNDSVSTGAKVQYVLPYGIEALWLPAALNSFWLGVRYSSITTLAISGDDTTEVMISRVALMLGKRWVSENFRHGPSLDLGVWHRSAVDIKVASTRQTYEAGSTQSLSAAYEASWVYESLILGAEGGYSYMVSRNLRGMSSAALLRDSRGDATVADFSGPFLQVLFGFTW